MKIIKNDNLYTYGGQPKVSACVQSNIKRALSYCWLYTDLRLKSLKHVDLFFCMKQDYYKLFI